MKISKLLILTCFIVTTSGCSLIDVETTRTQAAPQDSAAQQRLEDRMDNIEDRLERIEELLKNKPI